MAPAPLADPFGGTGEMAARCRALDWAATPLGPVAAWPVSLRTIVATVLAAPAPMIVLWGPEHVQLYNDGYRAIMGAKHPAGLGQPNRECWPEVWDFNAPLYAGVVERGASYTFTDQRLEVDRHGRREEAFFTLTFSPVPDDVGGIGGVLATVFETTAQVRTHSARAAERERLLAESEAAQARLTATLESIGDGFYALDPDFRFTYVNRRAEELLVRRRDALLGRDLWAEFPRARGTEIERRYRTAMAERQAAHFEAPSVIDGRWLDVSLYPDPASGGLACYFRDTTERNRAEAALRASEAKYRALFDSLDAGFCIVEVLFDDAAGAGHAVDYRFVEANPAFVRQTGLGAVAGRRIRELASAPAAHWLERYGRVARTGEPARFEAPADASAEASADAAAEAPGRWYDVYAFRVGEPAEHRVAVLFTDVSGAKAAVRDRERLLAELRAANDELRRLNRESQAAERRSGFLAALGAALQPLDDPDLVMATTARLLGEHLGVDRCAYAEVEGDENHFTITGNYTRGDTISIEGRFAFRAFGAEVLRLMHAGLPYVTDDAAVDRRVAPDDYAAYLRTQIRAVICVPLHKAGQFAAGMAVHQRTPRHWTRDDVELVVTVVRRCWESLERARAYRGLHAREAALRATSAQLADRTAAAEAAQAAAEAANRAKGEFLAVMSHELRTPLNAIGGYAELLELGIHGPVTAEQRQALDRIQQSQRHLLGLINQVLNYTRIDAGVVRYEPSAVVVRDALAATEALVVPQLRTRGLTYVLDPCAAPLVAWADREKLQQILLNLLTNAIKFTEPGGTVRVACAPHADGVAITVADTGIGIAAEKLASIFEPFVQVDQRHTRPHEGVGLGLAISRDLARGMGGDLTAESVAGRGSTFTLTLPAAAPG